MHHSSKRRESEYVYQDNMVLKRCLEATPKLSPCDSPSQSSSTTSQSNPQKSQSQSGHEN
jgi:hypothetical protein